jgi:hypothetical protein
MTGDVRRAGWTGAWVAIALCALAGCNASPSVGPTANARAAGGSVVDEVRAATDRSAAQRGVVTLSNGMQMRRVSNPNGYSHVLVGRRGPDGQPSVSCVDSAPAAESFLAGGKQGNGQ